MWFNKDNEDNEDNKETTIKSVGEYRSKIKAPYVSDEEIVKSIDEYISYWIEKGDNYVTYSDNPNKKYVYYYNYILNHLEEFKSKGFAVCIEPSNKNYPHNTIALIWGDVSKEYAFQRGVFKKEL